MRAQGQAVRTGTDLHVVTTGPIESDHPQVETFSPPTTTPMVILAVNPPRAVLIFD